MGATAVRIAVVEDRAIFDGYAAAGIQGIRQGSSNPTLLQSTSQSRFIDDRSACRVDEHGAGFHGAQSRLIDQAPSLGRERGVQGNEIRFGKELIQRNEFDAEILRRL